MIFAPSLAEKVLTGEKTVTRRRLTHRGGRPIGYKAGGVYAVQTGRGKPHLGHIEVLGVDCQPLGVMRPEDAGPEGFASLDLFRRYWRVLHKGLNLDEPVAVITFKLGPWCPDCAKVKQLQAELGEILAAARA